MFKYCLFLVATVGLLLTSLFPRDAGVPIYLQHDPEWGSVHLNGNCQAACTIKQQGCALTSVAMLFTYFGIKHTPDTINACMGSYAYPFSWPYAIELCGEGEVLFGGRLEYSEDILHKVVANGFMPIMSLLDREIEYEHWVLVVGQSSKNDYWIHDPDSDVAEPVLLSELLERWRPNWLILYKKFPPGETKPYKVDGSLG